MKNADEIGDVLRTEAQMSSTKQESTYYYPYARLRGVLSRMNVCADNVQNLRRQLEERETSILLLQQQIELLETALYEKRPQQAVDGTCDATQFNHIEWLENGLESRMQQLEQLLERRRDVELGVQAAVGEADQTKPSLGCEQRNLWWYGALFVLYSIFLILRIITLLNAVWPVGMGMK